MRYYHRRFFSLLLFVYTFLTLFNPANIALAQSSSSLPEAVQELLKGQTSDYASVVSQLTDTDLFSAISAVDLLRFKAAHNEINLMPKEVSHFKKLLFQQITNSSYISFSETETCSKKVPETTIIFEGQSILIPEHYTSNANLAITAYSPAGEAGTMFPAFDIDVFTQSLLTKHSFKIDGKKASTYFLTPKLSSLTSASFAIAFLSDLSPKSMLSIGTHTAELTLTNKSGEKVTKKWSFTVGVYDTPTPKLPDSAKVIKELKIDPKKILPGQKGNGDLSVIIYKDKNGNIYTEYKLKTSSGQIIKSRNLAFVKRKFTSTQKNEEDYIIISPKARNVFKGNILNFSYVWEGPDTVVSEAWVIASGDQTTNQTMIEALDTVYAECKLIIEAAATDHNGEGYTYTYEVSKNISISTIEPHVAILSDRTLNISNMASSTFDLRGYVTLFMNTDLFEGQEYTFGSSILKVDKMRWKIISSDAKPKIKNVVATTTEIILSKHGVAEVVFDIQLTWLEAGETYKSDYKPTTSALYAFYPVTGKAKFKKYPIGQLKMSERHIVAESFEFEILKQKRTLNSPNDFELAEPITICSSSLWPASAPIKITNAEVFVARKNYTYSLKKVKDFTFLTPMFSSDAEIELSLSGEFKYDNSGFGSYDHTRAVISDLAPIPVYTTDEIIDLVVDPSGSVSIPEGKDTEFVLSLVPISDLGTGLHSETENTLNILDGYKLSSIENILWYEMPIIEEGDWKQKALKTLDYSHMFNPILGSGSYEVHCGVSLNLKESDTGDVSFVYVEKMTPVEVTPGLHIFSPFEEMIYPLYSSLKVITSLDGEEDLETWQKIKWKLNGKYYKPDTGQPPFYLYFDKEGKWTLEAELEVEDPQTGEDIILKDTVNFTVKAMDIRLSPTRKVLDFTNSKSQAISLSISANNDTAEDYSDTFLWDENYDIYAKVSNIEWSVISKNSIAKLDSSNDSFDSILNFSQIGAATVQATVTIKLQGAEKLFIKHNPEHKGAFVWPELTFSAMRADVWVLLPPVWQSFEGKAAKFAIKNTSRLFSAESGQIKLGETYDWASGDDVFSKIKFDTAHPGGKSLVSTALKISWEGPNGQGVDKTEFKPSFANEGDQKVVMNSSIEFGTGFIFDFDAKSMDVGVIPLFKVISLKTIAIPPIVKVDQPSQLSFKFGEFNGEINNQSQFDLWNGQYNIKLDKVDWKSGDASISSTEPNVEFKRSTHGNYIISATPHFTVKPKYCDASKATMKASKTSVNVLGTLISWKVDENIPDHLDKIRYAENHTANIYDEANHKIWKQGKANPLVVGCDSTIKLIPEFGANKPKEDLLVNYQWLNTDDTINSEGSVKLAESIIIPTPEKINKYTLGLEISGFSTIALMPEVYVVKKITSATAKNVYYMKCVQDSVNAFGPNDFGNKIDDKILVDDFYNWWWSRDKTNVSFYKNKLEYARPMPNKTIYEVITRRGGYCQALGNYFYKCLESQGISNICRIGIGLINKEIVDNKSKYEIAHVLRKDLPFIAEYWGAIFIARAGLNRIKPKYSLPGNFLPSYYPYKNSKLNIYRGDKKIPHATIFNTVIIDYEKHIFPLTHSMDGYTYEAPDGHAVVIYNDLVNDKTFLYDLSFAAFDKPIEISKLDRGKLLLKELGKDANPKYQRLLDYLDKTITYYRGYTFFHSAQIDTGMSVFDFTFKEMNVLEVNISNYVSKEELK